MDAEPKEPVLKIDFECIGRKGKVRVTARLPDGTTHTDKVDIADADGRKRFLKGLCTGRKGIDRAAVTAELERIAGEVVEQGGDAGGTGEGSDEKANQAQLLIELASEAELFHTPGGDDSEGYATIQIKGHRETLAIAGKGFRRWIGRLYYEKYRKAPSSQSLLDALNVLAGKAIHDGPEHPVAVRLTELNGEIWLDLADAEWRAVRITPAGWRVVEGSDVPVKFLRKRGMLPLPVPNKGGLILELREFVNLPDDRAWVLFVAFLVAAFRPNRPFPVLGVHGEQGSAKSTACKMARALIDPNSAPLRRPPRDDRDLMIAAANGWIVTFDNMSGIPQWLSDAICTLATGGGFATRELYSDSDEKLFDATRPVILNGIDDIATRSDLLDRSINLTLPVISEENRRDEGDVWARFYEARPRVLGALLDAVCAAMRNLPSVRLERLPRMADFAKWCVAAEPALPWPPGSFLAAYTDNRGSANAVAIEASVIGPAVVHLMQEQSEWCGLARNILTALEIHHAHEHARRHKDWPSGPRKLSSELRRLAPNLRRAGIVVTFEPHTRHGSPIRIERGCKTPSPSSPPSPNREDQAIRGYEDVTVGVDPTGGSSHANPDESRHRDERDGRDREMHTHSSATDSGDADAEREERAAIMEFEGAVPRDRAEHLASTSNSEPAQDAPLARDADASSSSDGMGSNEGDHP